MASSTRAALLLALVLAAAALLPPAATAADSAGARFERITLQLQWRHAFRFAGYYAAIEQGYYRDAGLAVELRLPAPGEDPIEAVVAGKADYGIGTSELVLARSRGWDVVALAAIYQHSPRLLLARRDAGIDSVHDLAGERVMLERQAASLLAYLREEGVPAERLERVDHSYSVRELVEGRVAAMGARSTDEPFLLQQAGVDVLRLSPRAAGIDFYGDTLFTTGAEVVARPTRVRAFVEASLRGWRHALDHSGEVVDLIRARYSRERSRAQLLFEAERSRKLIVPGAVELGTMSPGRWRAIADVHASLGLMPHGLDVEAMLWDPRSSAREPRQWVLTGVLAMLGVLVVLVGWRLHRLARALRGLREAHADTEQALHASESRHRLLLDSAPFPVVISRYGDGVLRYVNPLAARTLALDPAGGVEHRAAAFYVRQADRLWLLEQLGDRGSVTHFETVLRARDGGEIWVDLNATRLRYDDEDCVFVTFFDVTGRKAIEQGLRHIADTDSLTGVTSRRRFLELLESEIALHQRYGRPVCVLSLDLDHFKRINDAYGHPAGDRVLAQVAHAIAGVLRAPDTLARLGGEEFAVLLRETGAEEAEAVAARVRATVADTELAGGAGDERLTVSAGVTAIGEGDTVASVLERVDGLLYQAKDAGRDRVASG